MANRHSFALNYIPHTKQHVVTIYSPNGTAVLTIPVQDFPQFAESAVKVTQDDVFQSFLQAHQLQKAVRDGR